MRQFDAVAWPILALRALEAAAAPRADGSRGDRERRPKRAGPALFGRAPASLASCDDDDRSSDWRYGVALIVVFDIGNVLIRWNPRNLFRNHSQQKHPQGVSSRLRGSSPGATITRLARLPISSRCTSRHMSRRSARISRSRRSSSTWQIHHRSQHRPSRGPARPYRLLHQRRTVARRSRGDRQRLALRRRLSHYAAPALLVIASENFVVSVEASSRSSDFNMTASLRNSALIWMRE